MEWNQENIAKLTLLFRDKWRSMGAEARTDRANMSAIWNKYVAKYDATILRDGSRSAVLTSKQTLESLIHLINFQNEDISGRLVILNPDRSGQWILIPRDIAERILVFGML